MSDKNEKTIEVHSSFIEAIHREHNNELKAKDDKIKELEHKIKCQQEILDDQFIELKKLGYTGRI